MPVAPSHIPIEEARRLLDYDPKTGVLRWRGAMANNRIPAGSIAGSIQEGRRVISFGGSNYKAARVIWAMMTGAQPVGEIDHRNTDASDDRWMNLRSATPTQNRRNTGARKTSQSGVKGVRFDRKAGRWAAEIQVDRVRHWLGYHDTKEAAGAAYATAAAKHHGEFARATCF